MRARLLCFAVVAATAAAVWVFSMTTGASAAFEASPPVELIDFFTYYRPNAEYGFTRLAGLELPLWNPRQGLGAPFLATLQTGVLYPPNWIHAFLPTQEAFAVLVALHLGLAAVLAAAFAEALDGGAFGAAVAGLSFALAGYLCGNLWAPPILYSAAWIPGVLLGVDRVAAQPSRVAVLGLAAAIAMQALAGWPYVLLMTGAAAALYACGCLGMRWVADARPPLAAASLLLLGVVLGFLLAAPQLLPARELAGLSARAPGRLGDAQAIWVSAAHDPARFLASFAETGVSDGIPGLAALGLAPFALLARGRGRGRAAVLLGIAGLALLISFADHTPVYGWLRALPVFSDFRFPMRYRVVATACLAVVGGVGAGRLFLLALQRSRALAALLGAGILLLLVVQARAIAAGVPAFPRTEAQVTVDPRVAALQAIARHGPAGSRALWDGRDRRERAAFDVPIVNDLEPLTLTTTARALSFLSWGRAGTLDLGPGKDHGAPFFGRTFLPPEPSRAALLDLLGIRYLVSDRSPTWLSTRFGPGRDADWGVFENEAALPRAWRVTHAEQEPADPQLALERLVAPGFDLRTTALLDAPPKALLGASAAAAQAGTTVIAVHAPEYVRLESEGPTPAVVILADAIFPGWEATVDGIPTPILRADTTLRGVEVPAGKHRVEFRYRPTAFRTGVVLALIALGASILALVLPSGLTRR